MHFQDKICIALQVFITSVGIVTNTIRMLCYLTRRHYTWIENEGIPKVLRKPLDNVNAAVHLRNPPVNVKMNVIHRCFDIREGIKCVLGVQSASPYLAEKISQGRALSH